MHLSTGEINTVSRRLLLVLAAWISLPPAAAADGPSASPRDLVDVAAIHALSLDDLGWVEETREVRGNVLVLGGSWKGPRLHGFDAGFEITEKDLSEYATVYVPLAVAPGVAVRQVVWAAHYESNARAEYPALRDLAATLPLAFVVHGEKEQDWISLGFSSRDALVGMTVLALSLANSCEPNDYRFGNYLLALAETNLRALTLLSRILEQEGQAPGPAGIVGLSKEGFAAWFASAVDDRLVAAAPGGWQLENIVEALTVEEANWGCEGSIGGAVGGTELFSFREWLAGSPGGRSAQDFFSVHRFVGDLYPEFFLLHGDVGLHDLHDGIYYTPGAETGFLEEFTQRPHRYDRQPDHGERETDLDRNIRLTEILANYLLARDLSAYPQVLDAQVETDGARLRCVARVRPAAGAVRLWWSHSDDRPFDDPGNAPWDAAPMEPQGGGTWVSPWVMAPDGEAVGWYVEAEGTVVFNGHELLQRDASPQRFLRLPPPLRCPGVPAPACTEFRRGDANADARLDISDAATILGFLFLGNPVELACLDAADTDDDGEIALTDAVVVLGYLFLGQRPPESPSEACGTDSTADSLSCASHAPCSDGG